MCKRKRLATHAAGSLCGFSLVMLAHEVEATFMTERAALRQAQHDREVWRFRAQGLEGDVATLRAALEAIRDGARGSMRRTAEEALAVASPPLTNQPETAHG